MPILVIWGYKKGDSAEGVTSAGRMRRVVPFVLILIPGWFRVYNSVRLGAPARSESEIERGGNLVEEVAKCSECHMPQNARRELDRNA